MAQPIRKADFEDPVLRALANPPQDEPETDEERAAVDEAMARREFVSSEAIQAEIEGLREAQEA